MRASLLAEGEALGQQCLCAGPETLERGEERRGPHQPQSWIAVHVPASAPGVVPGLLQVPAGARGGSVPGVGKAQDFFLILLPETAPEQRSCKLRESLATLQRYLPSHSFPTPVPCLHTPALR